MRRILILIPLLLLLPPVFAVRAQTVPVSRTQHVRIKAGSSRTFTFPDQITRLAVINPRIADVTSVTGNGFTMKAKTRGQTSLRVVFRRHQVLLRITVTR